MPTSSAICTELARSLASLIPIDGSQQSVLDGLVLMRASTSREPSPVLQYPAIVCMAQGLKRGYLGDEVFSYRPGQILVVSVPMQFLCDTVVAGAQPMLACTIRINPDIVRELTDSLPAPLPALPSATRGMAVADLGEPVAHAILRLLDCLRHPADARILGPALLRELHYRILQSPAGDCLRAVATHQGRLGRVQQAIDSMLANPSRDIEVAVLAKEAAMSVSTFHQAFKKVTGYSPLQYLKLARLHQARAQLLNQTQSVASVAFAVGYASANQFSREYRRLFGHSPSEAAQHRDSHD